MENFTPLTAIIGGLFIGLSATMLMWFSGRIAGISGIFFGAFDGAKHDTAWRWWFIVGLLVGAGSYLWATGPVYVPRTDFPLILVALAGIIVGVGTQLGSGCTSGHGVCGIARFSMRSILATITFMITGIATTYMVRHIVGVGL
jgi:uncharacterized membrane protein YedE/YeeE